MTMEATLPKTKFFKTNSSIILTILAVIGMWCLTPMQPLTIALLAVVVLFLFGLKKPLWAMAAFLVSQITATSYMVNNPLGFPISLRLSLLLLIGLILLRFRIGEPIKLGPGAKPVIVPTVILLIICAASDMIYSGFSIAFKDFREIIAGLLIIIFLPAVMRSWKDLKLLCGIAFVGIAVSAIIGLIQHFQLFGFSQKTLVPGFLLQWGDHLRVPGISESELELSYILTTAVLVIIGIIALKAIKNKRWLLVLSVIPVSLTLYFTYTRSALLAVVIGLLSLILFLKTRIKGEIILLILLAGVFLIQITGIMDNQFLGGRDQTSQQESSISRDILWDAGIAMAMQNPVLGIGGGQYSAKAPEYLNYVDPSLIQWENNEYWGYSSLSNELIHNDFLYHWVSYGTLALIIYLWMYFRILNNFLKSYRSSKRRFIKGLSIGLAAAVVAYGVNAFYHNLVVTFPLFWILAGFSVAVVKLMKSKEDKHQLPEKAPSS
jgi:putative inorganic carbon (HCO3(-)) transporter